MYAINEKPQYERRMSEVNLESLWTVTKSCSKYLLRCHIFPTCVPSDRKNSLFGELSRVNPLVSKRCSAAAGLSRDFLTTSNGALYSDPETALTICFQCFAAALLVWLAADFTPDPLVSMKQRATAHSDQMKRIMSSLFKFKSAVRWHTFGNKRQIQTTEKATNCFKTSPSH